MKIDEQAAAALAQQYRDGVPIPKISVNFGITHHLIYKYLQRMNIPRDRVLNQRRDPVLNATLAKRWRAGETLQALANELGVSRVAIHKRIKRHYEKQKRTQKI